MAENNLKYIYFNNITSNIVDKNSNVLLDVSNNRLKCNVVDKNSNILLDVSENRLNIKNLKVKEVYSYTGKGIDGDKKGDIQYLLDISGNIYSLLICKKDFDKDYPNDFIWGKINLSY